MFGIAITFNQAKGAVLENMYLYLGNLKLDGLEWGVGSPAGQNIE